MQKHEIKYFITLSHRDGVITDRQGIEAFLKLIENSTSANMSNYSDLIINDPAQLKEYSIIPIADSMYKSAMVKYKLTKDNNTNNE